MTPLSSDSSVRPVNDDALHIKGQNGLFTLCRQIITFETRLGTRDDLEADPGGACWTCEAEGQKT